MLRSLFTFFVLFVFFTGATPVRAQYDPDALNALGSQLIDSTMASLNIRAQRFNEELAKINALKPMDVTSLAKETIPKNRAKIKEFLSFLEVYRAESATLRQGIEDTVNALRSHMPSRHQASFMKEFLDAYDLDQNAFDKYTLALTKVFTNINAALDYIDQSDVTIKDNKLQFTSKGVYDKYSELITAVEKSNKKLINASAASQKATIDASSMMQKAYGALRK